MKKTNSNILLTALGLIFSSANSFATECTPAPDCASLGYNKTLTDCEGLATIKCQFDTSKVLCKDLSITCTVGTVLGNDQKCYAANNLPTSVKPVGIVFDVVNRLAVALTDVKKDGSAGSEAMLWSSEQCDISALKNCSSSSKLLTCGIDGRTNTDAILASNGGCSGTTYAANAVNAYQPSNCTSDFCKKGKWFLPSYRDLNTMYEFEEIINNSLTLITSQGASNLGYYWSSTEYDENDAWRFQINGGFKDYGPKNGLNHYVRPVVKY